MYDRAKSELGIKVLINLPPETEEQDRGKRDSKLQLRPAPHEIRDARYHDVTQRHREQVRHSRYCPPLASH